MSSPRRHRFAPQRFYPLFGLVVLALLGAFVYVSFTANAGLPWASTYDVFAQVPNADRLIKTDEVRIGGIRIGQVTSVTAEINRRGKPYSTIGLALNVSAGPLPADTRVEVVSASVLGQTFVDLTPGTSDTTLRAGATLPIANATTTVELTDLLDIFNSSTAKSIQHTLGEFGYAFAGRGADLNQTIYALAHLLVPFTTLSRTLADPETRLAGFLHGFEAFASALAPVSPQLADLVANGSTTFGALEDARQALGQTIDALGPAAASATNTLGELAQPLDALAALTVRLRAAGALLPSALTRLDSTLTAGVRPVDQLPAFSRALRGALSAVSVFSRVSTSVGAVRQLTAAMTAALPLLEILTPAQADCNIIGLFGRNFPPAWGSLGTGNGPSIVVAGVVTAGATAESLQAAAPANNLHINYLAHEDASECESGNEPYNNDQQDLANPPGNQSTVVPKSYPPAGVEALAQKAGLWATATGAGT
jgi:virulence factor Mce-like protein